MREANRVHGAVVLENADSRPSDDAGPAVLSWGTRTRTLNNSTRNCCVANYTIPHHACEGTEVYRRPSGHDHPDFVGHCCGQPVMDSSRPNPMMRPTATPPASFSSLPNAVEPVTGLVRVGDTNARRPNSSAIKRMRSE